MQEQCRRDGSAEPEEREPQSLSFPNAGEKQSLPPIVPTVLELKSLKYLSVELWGGLRCHQHVGKKWQLFYSISQSQALDLLAPSLSIPFAN